ncbi:heterodisulfide reductase-related iron-sulfur binding cluster [Castellaniella sp. GW247-6E4]|uniref:heterodisulfide reductase-related iron-sulfur binding cluster n=1 Tax=Castellaniella sp. GW247-6E4 TaxID=3140380 RepID=UPI00331521F8
MENASYTSIKGIASAFDSVRSLGKLLAPEDLTYLTEVSEDISPPEVLIHLSCMATYTPSIPLLAQKLLNLIGKSNLIMGGPDNCCGELHRLAQRPDLEKQTAKVSMHEFGRSKPVRVVSICPDCVQVFLSSRVGRMKYQYGAIASLFSEYMPLFEKHMKPLNMKVVLHTHSVNDEAVADAAEMRKIIERIPGLEIIESEKAHGPGIHCQTAFPMQPADRLVMYEEADRLGAQAIVVPYHSCYRQHCAAELNHKVKVFHYLHLLAMSMGVGFVEEFKKVRLFNDIDLSMRYLTPKIEEYGLDADVVRAQVIKSIYANVVPEKH